MDNALETLFYPLENGLLDWPSADQKAVFVNAKNHSALSHFKNLSCQQHFYPYAKDLNNLVQNLSDNQDIALILLPKNRIEADYMIASTLSALKPGGLLVTAADNKAGGARLVKTLEKFGLTDISNESKNKARVTWATNDAANQETIKAALEDGSTTTQNNFHTQPGIYGWNKIDQGSALLTQHLPEEIKGHGADFGCGYGYLSHHLLKNYDEIKALACIDADARAIECCKLNLEEFPQATFIWEDLTKPTALKNLDFIVMNPPFHEGKKTDISIGQAFIQNAAEAIKRNGKLYMVANKQLPYETILEDSFFKVEKLFEGQGFKIFEATK